MQLAGCRFLTSKHIRNDYADAADVDTHDDGDESGDVDDEDGESGIDDDWL